MSLFINVEDQLGQHESNFFMNINDDTRLQRENKNNHNFTGAVKLASANQLSVGDQVRVKTADWVMMRDNNPRGRIVKLTDSEREGLKPLRNMSLFHKHLFLFSANGVALEKQFGTKKDDYQVHCREIFQRLHDRLNCDVDDSIDLTEDNSPSQSQEKQEIQEIPIDSEKPTDKDLGLWLSDDENDNNEEDNEYANDLWKKDEELTREFAQDIEMSDDEESPTVISGGLQSRGARKKIEKKESLNAYIDLVIYRQELEHRKKKLEKKLEHLKETEIADKCQKGLDIDQDVDFYCQFCNLTMDCEFSRIHEYMHDQAKRKY